MIKERVGVKTQKKDRSGKPTSSSTDWRDGCTVWPRRSAEGEQGRVVLSGWNVRFPAGAAIPSDAQLVVRGQDYALFGKVADYGKKGMIAQCRTEGED